jgi:hypothetical protein
MLEELDHKISKRYGIWDMGYWAYEDYGDTWDEL